MADSKENNPTNKSTVVAKNEGKKIKVLYQYLGGQWYAFAEDDSEVYFGKVPLNASTKTSGLAKKNPPAKKTPKESK